MKKDRDFVSKKRAREREVIVRRGAKSRTLEDSRHSSGRCTDRAKVIPAWCATVLHTANGVGNSLGLAVPGISALLLARYPSPRDKDVTASWRPTIPSPLHPRFRFDSGQWKWVSSWSLVRDFSFIVARWAVVMILHDRLEIVEVFNLSPRIVFNHFLPSLPFYHFLNVLSSNAFRNF